jgi:hypothetical protein
MMVALGRTAAIAAVGAALGALSLILAFAGGPGVVVTFDSDPPKLVSGMFPAERDEHSQLTFAWTGRDLNIRLPGLDRRREWTLEVRARSGRADPRKNPSLSFYADGVHLSTHPSTTDFDVIRVVIPARPQRPRGAILRMDVSATEVPGPNDRRALGVMVDELRIAPAGRVWPPAGSIAGAAAGAAAFGAAVALLASVPAALAAALAISIGQAALLSRGFGPYSDYPVAAAWLAGWIALAVAVIAVWVARRRTPASAPARFVIAFSGAALFLKLLVLLHPQMPVGDAMFHAHRFQGVLAGNLYFTSIAPGNYTFPYPPGFYLFAALFERFVTRGAADMNLLRVVALTVDAIAGAALYIAVRRNWTGAWTAALAVVVYQMLPLEFRIFTVGNLTNAFAQSVSVLALAVVAGADFGQFGRRQALVLTVTLAVAFMSHTSTFAILLGTCICIAALFAWRGDASVRRVGALVLLATLVALGLAVALYYAHFGATYRAEFSRISTETVSATPYAGGRDLSVRAHSVPGYLNAYLGWGALVLAACGASHLYRAGARDRLTLATAGWALSCTVFLIVGILTPVDMRYYLAAVPAVAVAAAAGVAALWRPGPGRMAAVALAALVCWGGVITWYTTF